MKIELRILRVSERKTEVALQPTLGYHGMVQLQLRRL